ncbi:MAG: hypothetical protein ACTMHL_01990 [Janibacter sp.]
MAAPYSPIDAVKYGWTAFTRNVAPFLVLTIVSLVIGGAINVTTNLLATGSVTGVRDYGSTPDMGEMLATQAVSLGSSFVVTLISWVIAMAMMRGAIDVVDTGHTDLGAMFSRINWGAAVGAAVLATLAIWAGILACFVPGLIIAFLLWFVSPAVIDGESATGALAASYRFTSGHVGDVLLFGLLSLALVVVGICTCGLGLLVVTPVLTLGMAYTWRVLQGRPVAP